MARTMGVDIKGRVKNFSLVPNQHNSHLPVLEAIVNAIQAIYDKIKAENLTTYNGKIDVILGRENDLIAMQNIRSNDTNSKVEKVTIIDNGIGFDEENFSSFLTADSERKEDIGGKGVGRFSWLKAFDNVFIESVFCDNGVLCKRKFDFNTKTNEIDDKVIEIKDVSVGTTVVLDNANVDFKKWLPVGIDIWARRIIKHCFMYFFDKNCPQITLTDGKETMVLNKRFNEYVFKFSEKREYKISNEDFEISHLKVDKQLLEKHTLALFGNTRCVREVDLGRIITDIKDINLDGNYNYLAIVESKYLDKHVDINRLAFDLPEEETRSLDNLLSIEQINRETKSVIEEALDELLSPVIKEKHEKIAKYINNMAPQYRHLLKYKADEISKFENGDEGKIDEQLYELDRRFERELREERKIITNQMKKGNLTVEEYEGKFNECVNKITDSNKSKLVEYIAHRKAIIDLFETGLKLQSDEKYKRENYMHKLIYPMKSTSEEITHDQQNLWLIDERLSYFFYASSDIPFDNDQKEDRTDIMLFDKPISLIDEQNNGTAYDKVVIFELKRPMREDLQYDEQNPVSQILKYMEKIQNGNVKDKNGRLIKVDDHTKFYLYVVCDVLPLFKKTLMQNHALKETTDGLGYFRMDENFYLEVLSYDKILNDAKKRNQILFDKLGLN